MKSAISVSYPADHLKGDRQELDPILHLRMLEACVDYLLSEDCGPVVVCAEGFAGLVPATFERPAPEREIWGRIFARARVVSAAENPGHCRGTNLCIRMGLEAAAALGCDALVHTCEDVVPRRGVLRRLLEALEADGVAYAGDYWRDTSGREFSTQLFACRVAALLSVFSGLADTPPEQYMALCLKDHLKAILKVPYAHTHAPEEFLRLAAEERSRP